jgi:integrase
VKFFSARWPGDGRSFAVIRQRDRSADLDRHGRARLSYQQAEALFTKASGDVTLRQLRHSALTHDAEDGTSTPMLMRRSGHASIRSLASTRE